VDISAEVKPFPGVYRVKEVTFSISVRQNQGEEKYYHQQVHVEGAWHAEVGFY
jgi:hypothetical protein